MTGKMIRKQDKKNQIRICQIREEVEKSIIDHIVCMTRSLPEEKGENMYETMYIVDYHYSCIVSLLQLCRELRIIGSIDYFTIEHIIDDYRYRLYDEKYGDSNE